MKHESLLKLILIVGLFLGVGFILMSRPTVTQAQSGLGTAFSYQGRLTEGGSPANGLYDLQFVLYEVPAGGAHLGSPISIEDVVVTDGVFTVTLDFGNLFVGQALWLEIGVRSGAESGSYTILNPRQPLLPAPYALNSASAGALNGFALSGQPPTAGQVLKWDGAQWTPDADNTGGSGGGPVSWHELTDIPADLADGDQDTTYSAGTGLTLDTNSNQFSLNSAHQLPQHCSTDQIIKWNGSAWGCAEDPSVALEARIAALETLLTHVSRNGNDLFITGANLHVVNGTGSTDGTPNSAGNVIIGYNEERVSGNDRSGSHMLVVGSKHNYSSFGGIVVGTSNTTSGEYASVSGGVASTASGHWSSVSGGSVNTASGDRSSVSGGRYNVASGNWSSVNGGRDGVASGGYASVSGGLNNEASGLESSVSGGEENLASGNRSSVSGGLNNATIGNYSSVSGGHGNEASGEISSVSGGEYNNAIGNYSSVSGGYVNTASGGNASVSGGYYRTANDFSNWVAGSLFEDH